MGRNKAPKILFPLIILFVLIASIGYFPNTAYAATFSVGDTVIVTTALNVRTGPGTSYPEITDPDYYENAPAGTIGQVIGGPISAEGYVWWQIHFGPGLYSGWSVEGGLQKVTSTLPPNPPSLIAPSGSGKSLTPVFQWTSVSGADYYGLYISEPPYGPSNLVYENEGLTGTSLPLPSGYLEPGVTYYWNMRSHNSAGWGSFSSSMSFTTEPASPPPPGSFTLSGEALCDGTSPYNRLSWSTSSGVNSYAVYRNGSLYYSLSTLGTTFDNTEVTPGQSYTYFIRATNSAGSTNSNTITVQTKTVDQCGGTSPPVSPPSPSSLIAPSGSGKSLTPVFQWTSVSGADYYGLYISEPPYGSSNLVYENESLTGTSLSLPSGYLNPGVTYYWNMRAHNSAGWGSFSSSMSFTTEPTPPPPPTSTPDSPNLIAPSGSGISLTPLFQWTSVSGADYYGLYISEPPYGPSNLVYENEGLTGTSLPLPSGYLEPGVTYYWNMRSHNSAGWGSFSSSASFTTVPAPPPPSGSFTLSGEALCDGTSPYNHLSWSTSSGVNSYAIYRNGSLYYSLSTLGTTFSNTEVTPGQSYTYFIRATNAAGSTDSNTVTIQTKTLTQCGASPPPASPPSPPSLITPSGSSQPLTPLFRWSSVSGADRYGLYISEPPYGLSNLVYENENLTGTSLTLPSGYLDPGITYYWNMRSRNSAGWGSFSSSMSFTTEPAPSPSLLPSPSLNSPSSGASSISTTPTFSWSAISEANKYWLMVANNVSALPTDPNATSAPGCVIAIYTTSTSYTPSSALNNSTTYYWQVQAFNDSASPIRQGKYSAQWSFTTTPTRPPGSFTLSSQALCDSGNPYNLLSWTPSSGVTSYAVYRNGSLYYNLSTLGTTFENNEVVPEQSYTYFIRATNAVGFTDSNTVTITTKSCHDVIQNLGSEPLPNAELANLVKRYFPDGIVKQTGESIWVTAYAIAKAESEGIPTAVGDNGASIGIWQINIFAHPNYEAEFLFDVDYNAMAAREISKNGTDWNAWCTWEESACGGNGNGRYRQWLEQARTELGKMNLSLYDDATSDTTVPSLDDEPDIPTTTALENTGTVIVRVNLNDAQFTITGADDIQYEGRGAFWSALNVPVGEYTILYGEVSGYEDPASEKRTLFNGKTITFIGEYKIRPQQPSHPSDMLTFFTGVLKELGIAPSGFALNALHIWATKYENTKAQYNPLATTLTTHKPGETNFNDAGVKNYPDMETGIGATVETFSLSYYTPIREMLALKSFNEDSIKKAVAAWSGLAESDDYVQNLVNEWQENQATYQRLLDRIHLVLKSETTYPEYFWIPLKQAEYDELYQAGVDFDILGQNELIKAYRFLNRGELENANRYYHVRYLNFKLTSDKYFSAAAEFAGGYYEKAETIVRGIYEADKFAAKLVAKAAGPQAVAAVNALYYCTDFAIDWSGSSLDEAVKNLMIDAIVDVIFSKVEFDELGDRTLKDFLENRVSKITFPFIQEMIGKNKQAIVSRIIKEASSIGAKEFSKYAGEELNELLDQIVDKLAKRLIEQQQQIKLESPGELRVYDSKGHVSGLVNGSVKHEIQRSLYEDGTVTIFFPSDSYQYEVAGKDNGSYGLVVISTDGEIVSTFTFVDVPISKNATHQYMPQWDKSTGTVNKVGIKLDSDGDGIFEEDKTVYLSPEREYENVIFFGISIGVIIAFICSLSIVSRVGRERYRDTTLGLTREEIVARWKSREKKD
jgi:hypothetical protein